MAALINKNKDFLLHYISMAPLALAFERSLECRIFQSSEIVRPALDVGCGDGLFAHILFREKVDTGIDPNAQELNRARKLNAYEELIMCRADRIPKPGGAYKTIFSNSVLEHIPDLSAVFNEIYRLLAPGGSFYMTVPAPEFQDYTVVNFFLTFLGLRKLAARYRNFCSRVIWRQMHYNPAGEWQKIAEKHGFCVSDAFTFDPKAFCLLNDLLYPFGIFALIEKRLFNRWTLIPLFRRVILFPVYIIAKYFLSKGTRAGRGGLVFLSLKKPVKI